MDNGSEEVRRGSTEAGRPYKRPLGQSRLEMIVAWTMLVAAEMRRRGQSKDRCFRGKTHRIGDEFIMGNKEPRESRKPSRFLS